MTHSICSIRPFRTNALVVWTIFWGYGLMYDMASGRGELYTTAILICQIFWHLYYPMWHFGKWDHETHWRKGMEKIITSLFFSYCLKFKLCIRMNLIPPFCFFIVFILIYNEWMTNVLFDISPKHYPRERLTGGEIRLLTSLK